MAQAAFGPCPPAVFEGDVFDDGQSQAGSAEFPASGFVHSVKALEYPIEFGFGDSGSFIGNR